MNHNNLDNEVKYKELDVALGMLKRAEKDLKVSQRDYKKQDFAHSVTNMQQAVEKFGKSILLSIDQCKEEDLKNKIGHKLVDFIIRVIKGKLDEIAGAYPELEQVIRKSINSFQSDYKKKYKMDEDLFLEFHKLKQLLKDYQLIENQIRTGTFLMLDNFPMQLALTEWFNTSDDYISHIEHQLNIELTDEQRIDAKNEMLNYLVSGQYFKELQNTLYVVLLLSYIVILSVNLEKHVSSSRYDIREERYSKRSEIVKILPLMNKTMSKMVNTCYYLMYLNPEENQIS